MLQLLPFSYTRHSLSFHLCNTLSLLGTAAAPSNFALALHMYFNFLFLFHFAHCATQHSTAQHNTTRHNFSLLYFHCRHSACVCVCVCMQYSLLVCVCRSFTTAIWLCFMLSFFLLPSLCTRIHTDTQTHTLGTRSRTHTREQQQQQHAGTQRNAAPQDSVFIRDDTGRITALGNR